MVLVEMALVSKFIPMCVYESRTFGHGIGPEILPSFVMDRMARLEARCDRQDPQLSGAALAKITTENAILFLSRESRRLC